MKIPRKIHQVWSGIEGPYPQIFENYKNTWLRDYPSWEYILWDQQKMNDFIIKFYPQYWEKYNDFPYNIQRWDIIRYLILYKYGGMYADLDYESLRPLDSILSDQTCCFACESTYNDEKGNLLQYFNNALILSSPKHFFIKAIIDYIFSDKIIIRFGLSKSQYVLNTTGPLMITKLYHSLPNSRKKKVYIIPAEYVTPISYIVAGELRAGNIKKRGLTKMKIDNAYAIHHFYGSWLSSEK